MNHIPESPPEREALLAEALEALAKFPVWANFDIDSWISFDNIDSWYRERALPTRKMLEAHLSPDSVTPST